MLLSARLTAFYFKSKCLDYNEQSSHTNVIRKHYVFLLETLDVKFTGLVGHLFSAQILSAVDREDIAAEPTSFRANEKFLSVLSRKSPQQFQLFLDVLDNCGQPHVRNVIDDRRGHFELLINRFLICLFLLHRCAIGNKGVPKIIVNNAIN